MLGFCKFKVSLVMLPPSSCLGEGLVGNQEPQRKTTVLAHVPQGPSPRNVTVRAPFFFFWKR